MWSADRATARRADTASACGGASVMRAHSVEASMPGSDVANDYTDEQIETLAQLAYEARPRDNWEQFVDECQEAAVALTSPKPAKTLYEVVLALHLNAEALSDTLRELLQRDEDLQFLLRTRHGRTGKTQALLSDINGFANAARLAIKRERVRRR